jgi:hypothetical protein
MLGVAVGAALGQSESSKLTPQQWANGVVAATEATGTAHFRYANVTTSADPSQDSTSEGIGVIDFSKGAFRVVEVVHQEEFVSTNGGSPRLTSVVFDHETIAIGQNVYSGLHSSVRVAAWSSFHIDRNESQSFGLTASGAEDALGGLVGPTPVDAVRVLGPGSVDGVAATRYQIETEPLYVCGKHGQTLFFSQPAPTTLWVDGQGRLLRTRTSVRNPGFSSHAPDVAGVSPQLAVAASTTVATLTFSHFGLPVHISAPPLSGSTGGSASISLRAKGSTSPCRR